MNKTMKSTIFLAGAVCVLLPLCSLTQSIGYQPAFLGTGFDVPLPTFSDSLIPDVLTAKELPGTSFQNGTYTKYIHFSIATNKRRRQPIVVALNIDQSQLRPVPRGDWRLDEQVGDFQLDNSYYRHNVWDRGHLAPRSAAAWGSTDSAAKAGSDATMIYSNVALQHSNFNGDEWLALEDFVKDLRIDSTYRISTFTGPIYTRRWGPAQFIGSPPAQIPTAFFKVLVFIGLDGTLQARAFIMAQDPDAISDTKGRSRDFDLSAYRVPVSVVEGETGLVFSASVHDADRTSPGRDPPSMVPVRNVYIYRAMPNPAGEDDGNEYVDVVNFGDSTVDLRGWTISDTKRPPATISGIVSPNRFRRYQSISPVILANSGGTIVLADADGNLVDRVTYSRIQAKSGVVIQFR